VNESRSRSKLLATVSCAAVLMGAAPMAFGDAPCGKGFRDSTAAERATMTAILQAARKALPPAPTGWVILGDDQIGVTMKLCRDYEGAPWVYHFNRNYQRVDDQEARDKIIADAAAASQAALAQKQPRLDAAMAKMNKIVAKQVALIEKGDMAGAQALNDDVASAQAEYQKAMDEGDSQAQFEAAAAKAGRDITMYINVVVNSNQETTDPNAKSLPPPPGARAAFRWPSSRQGDSEDHAMILLGQWQPAPDGVWKRLLHPAAAPTAAQVISISVTADPERIAGVIGAIDVKSLATLVPK
jgi:hypothetical protein